MTGPPSAKVTVDLGAILSRYQITLQHLTDRVAVGNSVGRHVTEQEYNRDRGFSTVSLAANAQIPFSAVEEDFKAWCLRNAFVEAMDGLAQLLEDAWLALSVVRLGPVFKARDFHKLRTDKRREFHRLGLPEKISRLQTMGATSARATQVLSLNTARNCIVHRGGIVGEHDGGDEGALVVNVRAMELVIQGENGVEHALLGEVHMIRQSSLGLRQQNRELRFKVGTRVKFTAEELNHAFWTLFLFARDIVGAVQRSVSGGESNPR